MNVIAMINNNENIGHISIHFFKNKIKVLQDLYGVKQLSVPLLEQYVDRLNAHKYTLERLNEAIAFFLDNAGTRYKFFPKISDFLEFKGTPEFNNIKRCEKSLVTAEDITRECWKTHIRTIEFDPRIKITKEEEASAGKNIAFLFAQKKTDKLRALKAFERWKNNPLSKVRLPEPRDIYSELIKI